jgi:hypothetical protein
MESTVFLKMVGVESQYAVETAVFRSVVPQPNTIDHRERAYRCR